MREKRVKAGETDMYERADTQERRSSEKQTLNQHARGSILIISLRKNNIS